jgi:glycosyltransferase A (GT-A) superfamily protein (DUF2064 family)
VTVDPAILVIAKEPRPGHVKTRLTPPRTPDEAADLAAAALEDTLDVVARTPARQRVLVFEGDPARWAPGGFEVIPQVSGGLDVRIAAALAAVDGPMLLIGMDTPQVSQDLLLGCDFHRYAAWLGPAEDGGYWALGLAEPDPALVLGVPMSVSYTCAAQRERLVDSGLSVGELPTLRDVDTWPDAEQGAASAPETRFARLVRKFAK